jgi:deoxyribodipyrimidine photo-lyase
VKSDDIETLDLLPHVSDWTVGVGALWTPGEAAAAARLADFVAGGLAAYAERRDRPSASSSMLSPHLRFGEVSPFQVWNATATVRGPSADKFRAELGWREYAWHVLARFPALATENLNPTFDRFPWQEPFADEMWAWRRGRTGYPIVDAGMRQLWQTGWMHNRIRMVVASFLVKHLLAPWQVGEEWFRDTLVDADPANNPFGWQWVAGSGADAHPYFRIFNPVLQGERFDRQGTYVRRYVPEIAALPDRFIHRPWQAPPAELAAAGITLGKDYPLPIVEHAEARRRALAAFDEMRRLSRISPETPPDEARFPR